MFIMEKDGSESYIIKNDLYPIVEKVLNTQEGQKKFSRLVGDFINRNSSKLTTIGPQYLIPFTYADKNGYYELFNITENHLKEILNKMIKNINDKANWAIFKNNPIVILFYCIIRYFTIKKDSKQLNNALIITSLVFYPLTFTKYFKFEPNPGIMHYTIDNLSKRFTIKKNNHIFGTLVASIQGSWKFHEKDFFDGSDKEVVRFLQRIRNDQNSLLKKIRGEFEINYRKGLTISTTVDSYDNGGVIVDIENDSNKVDAMTDKIVTKLLINGVNLRISDFAAQGAGVSKIDLRNYLTKIINDKNGNDMRSLIESILFLYLYDEKKTVNDINSKQFIAFSLLLFKKTNSKNQNITNIKNILEKFSKDSGIYSKYTRIPTRVDYSKAIFLYFIVSIQQYTN